MGKERGESKTHAQRRIVRSDCHEFVPCLYIDLPFWPSPGWQASNCNDD